ncbi:metallophosphoesterase family protein [Propylenella binzhouense]|uniref:Metallophosphoesterase n=1 Tax=Propylenella binzhouense TaxID=2555902 RepID=A0A964T2C4_9HYPH|nr:metallophosphoesterase [Propylenella binzhouense]MYZ47085.1 metallophosphoesterase [Propylenella binzhouense]
MEGETEGARLKVAALADLHVGETDKHAFRDLFAEISRTADVMALAGDLTNLGTVQEAEVLAEDLHSCSIPVVAVLGNHDHECGCAEEVTRILRQVGVCVLEGSSTEIDGVAFVGVKGFAGGFGRFMLGSFGENAIKTFVSETLQESLRLENALRAVRPGRVVVLLHYAPIVDTVKGEPPEIYPFLGCSRLAETIERFPVSAIVHGHAHHGTFEGRTASGVPVYNVARMIEKPGGKPYHLIEI